MPNIISFLLSPTRFTLDIQKKELTILWPTAAFRHTPSDILRRNFDRASLALSPRQPTPFPSCITSFVPKPTHMNTILTINHKLFPRSIRIPSFGILILVNCCRAGITQQSSVLSDILFSVSFFCTGLTGELEVRRLSFDVVCTCPSDRGKNVE